MPLECWPHPNLLAVDDDALIWRYLRLNRFADLVQTSELYFCRCDLFEDQDEGMPTADYIRWVCEHQPVGTIDHQKGILEQQKEASFASCWYSFDVETAKMWAEYGRDGVAVVSRFGKLKAVLEELTDRIMVGPIKYAEQYHGYNVLRFVTTKRLQFDWEREIRALIWVPEWAGQNRHFDENNHAHPKPLTPPPPAVPHFLRRIVDLRQLLERVVISPEATKTTMQEVTTLLTSSGISVPVDSSSLSGYSGLITNVDEIVKYSR